MVEEETSLEGVEMCSGMVEGEISLEEEEMSSGMEVVETRLEEVEMSSGMEVVETPLEEVVTCDGAVDAINASVEVGTHACDAGMSKNVYGGEVVAEKHSYKACQQPHLWLQCKML
ncbi:unnamed protein product [Dovyalis caffra]|uniref:Uncharacterized protein n=1 Tax=Dovyalis caffra TaxID=77055 RepID=A0AAV1RUY1_9ROSI|nr:unnamed protein product [Dovyalis caffra]